jgi:hypothetical protein
LTAFLAGDVLANAFLAIFLPVRSFAFFAAALTAGFFTFFVFFAFVVFFAFTGIGPAPQFDDF